MEKPRLAFVVAFTLSTILAFFGCTQAHDQLLLESERIALRDLRASLRVRSTYWPIKANPCESWTGIRCMNRRVVGINVSGLKRTRRGRFDASFSFDSMANFTFLEYFNASGFLLPGPVPDFFGFQPGSLQVLDLSSCQLNGLIPASLVNLTRLNALVLSNNGLTGDIPAALGQLYRLSVLDLSRNWLTGPIPSGFASLSNLSRLDLSSNFLSGWIPSGLGSISTMQVLDLSDNSFEGPIPEEFGKLSLLMEMNLGGNSFSGPLPENLKDLRNLRRIEVGDNELDGSLTDSLFSNLINLEVVDFSVNRFDGALSGALWSLPNLRILDVSHNAFSNDLDSFRSKHIAIGAVFNFSYNMFYGTLAVSFWNLSSIDLSGNFVRGKVPDGILSDVNLNRNCLEDELNQRSSEDCISFYDERGLPFKSFWESAEQQKQPPSKKRNQWGYVLIGLLCAFAFTVMIMISIRGFFKTFADQRGSRKVGPVPDGFNPSRPKGPTTGSSFEDSFTFEELLTSTNGFSEKNVIKHGHSGDLFRGNLKGGFPVVIKKVDLHSTNKELYSTELEFFYKCSHTRMVPLLGHYLANENAKFLVYQYMPNGDLVSSWCKSSSIGKDGRMQSPDWITRLKFAVGAAEGLSYLHHECDPPIIHRDVQASSILLDDKFDVRLGSFSEVRVQEPDPNRRLLMRLLQKPQSSAETGPFGLSSATCAYDVYCFGKVLLELITGNPGISKSDDANTKEWLEQTLSYVSVEDKELVTKIIDPSLIINEDLLLEVWAMAIVAKSCLNPKTSKRPMMKNVLKALENPLEVVREENHSPGRPRSSRGSWSATLISSLRRNSLDNSASVVGQSSVGVGALRQPGRTGPIGSSGVERAPGYKKLSNELFQEPLETRDRLAEALFVEEVTRRCLENATQKS